MDESAYMFAAKAITDGRGYIMWIIAPMFTYILALAFYIFGFSELVAKAVAPTFAVLSVIAMYYLAREFFDKKHSAIAALVLATLPIFMVLGERIMTEIPYTFFFILSLLFFIRAVEKDKKYLLLLVAIFITGFLIKYSTILLLFIFALYFIIIENGRNKLKDVLMSKWLLTSFIIGIILMMPMFFYSQSLFENPVKLFFVAFSTYNIEPDEPWYFYLQAFPLIAAATLPFAFYGAYTAIKMKNKKMLWIFLSLSSLFLYRFLFLAVMETRYLIDITPFLTLLVTFAFFSLKFNRGVVAVLFALMLAINIFGGVYAINTVANDPKYVDMLKASVWVKENCKSPILTNIVGPLRYYYIDADIEVIGISNETLADAKKYGCVVYSKSASLVQQLELWEPTISFGNVLIYRQ